MGTENIFQKIMAEIFPNLMKTISPFVDGGKSEERAMKTSGILPEYKVVGC